MCAFLRVEIEKFISKGKQLVISRAREASNAKIEGTRAPLIRITSEIAVEVARRELEVPTFRTLPLLVLGRFSCLAPQLTHENERIST